VCFQRLVRHADVEPAGIGLSPVEVVHVRGLEAGGDAGRETLRL